MHLVDRSLASLAINRTKNANSKYRIFKYRHDGVCLGAVQQ